MRLAGDCAMHFHRRFLLTTATCAVDMVALVSGVVVVVCLAAASWCRRRPP